MNRRMLRFAALLAVVCAGCSGLFVAGSGETDAGVDAQTLPDASPSGTDAGPPPDASPGDAQDAIADTLDSSVVCGLFDKFHTIGRIEHSAVMNEVDVLEGGTPTALVPVPGKAEAWLIAASPSADPIVYRVVGDASAPEGGAVRYSGGAKVVPFDLPAPYDGLAFTPQLTVLVGGEGGIYRALPGAPNYGTPIRVVLPTPVTQVPYSPFVTADGRTLLYTADFRLWMSTLPGPNVDAPPTPVELAFSFGSSRAVATPDLASAYWLKNGAIVRGAIRGGALSNVADEVPELATAAPGPKYPTWLSADGCLLYFVQEADAGRRVLWFAKKGK